jgi:hypothetical protein
MNARSFAATPIIAIALSMAVAVNVLGEAKMKGTFTISKSEYVMLEPIVVKVRISNEGDESGTIQVGSDKDYRDPLCGANYHFDVTGSDGKVYTRFWGMMIGGGLGYERPIFPADDPFSECVLLNCYAYILPPGKYKVHATRTTTGDSPDWGWKQYCGPTVQGDFEFKVRPYDARRLRKALEDLHHAEADLEKRLEKEKEDGYILENSLIERSLAQGVEVSYLIGRDCPCFLYGTAVEDIRLKLRIKCTMQQAKGGFWVLSEDESREYYNHIISQLPNAWDDKYYIEARLEVNRNWVTASQPEDLIVSFSVENHSNTTIPFSALHSWVCIDGEEWDGFWALYTNKYGTSGALALPPGKSTSISAQFNPYLHGTGQHTIEWHLDESLEDSVAIDIK